MARLSGRSIWLMLAMVTPAVRAASRRLTAMALAIASGSAEMITSTWSAGENCCQNSGSLSAVDVFMQRAPHDWRRHHTVSRLRKQDKADRSGSPSASSRGERDALPFGRRAHARPLGEPALQELERKRVLHQLLNRALERPGAVDRVVAPSGQKLPGA